MRADFNPVCATTSNDAVYHLPTPPQVDPGTNLPLSATLNRPTGAVRGRILWRNAVSVTAIHAISLLAILPWFFSWSGVALAFAGLYVFGTLGINLGYHRLLTHRGFICPLWLERVFAILGVCCLQEGPARWVAIHRLHHQHSDEVPDPHSPLVAFFWGHMGWLFVQNRDLDTISLYERYVPDMIRDPFYLRLERRILWAWVYILHVAIFALAGFIVGALATHSLAGGLQLSASWVIWGVAVRTVAVWHITWSVNSLSHLWGYRSYETDENSRNNWFVSLISNGEGWHNNHHADQRAAAHGHGRWELDVTWQTIRCLRWVGLAKNVVVPKCWNQPIVRQSQAR